MRGERAPDEFTRLHRIFTEHLGLAVGFAWAASAYAAAYAPWVRNIRGLIDPFARPESTASYLFALPALMTVAWLCLAFGGEAFRRTRVLKNQSLEFGLSGLVAFAVFCMAVYRAVTAYSLGL
ncbi:hypothetical protein HJG44_11250 [Enterovirga sp. DB1703]|uniref:Uncharacterized protein n=1 Tax=Enterovirga aerilata TaxID=2730920 RepID=A0A849I5I0_9HYPH|nr:hypothetical protein [Enterovirga sp. DB1703]